MTTEREIMKDTRDYCTLYQIKAGSPVRRDAMFYKENGKIFNKEMAIKAMTDGHYDYKGMMLVEDLDDAFAMSNNGQGPENAYSMSVGDILFFKQQFYIVAPVGFDLLINNSEYLETLTA